MKSNDYPADIILSTEEVSWLTGIPEDELRSDVRYGKSRFGKKLVLYGRVMYSWNTNAVLDYVIDNETLHYDSAILTACKTCTDRHDRCHDSCEKYRQYRIIRAIRKRHANRFEQLNRSSFGMVAHKPGGKYAKFDNDTISDNHKEG